MTKSYLLLALFSLLLCTACGSSSSGTIPGFIPKGNYSNASLNGQFVYQIQGFDFGVNPNGVAYREAGVLVANGNGAITSVTDDFSEGGTVFSNVGTGVYSVNNDGTGTMSFTSAAGPITLGITLASASKVYLIEGDTTLSAGGLAEKQNPAAIAAVPNGTFVFREHDINAVQSVGSVGAFTMSGGVVSAGAEDVNRGGSLSSLTFTAGSFNAPDAATGRGTATLTDSSPATSNFFYYIVDANNIRFLSDTPAVTGLGQAELQNGTPNLSGSYAFGSKGDTANLGGVNTVGRFTASGGTITAGARDSVQDGNSGNNVSFTGTYTQPSSGRFLVTLTTAANNSLIIWMVSPSRGFFVVNDPLDVQEGTLDLQQTATFSNSTMNGQFAFVMNGLDFSTGTTITKDRVGTLQWDGSGKLILNELTNANGSASGPIVLSGNYSVSANGRAGGSISSLSNNLVFYLVSGTDAYSIQNDSQVEINGVIGKQQ
ncbi:MAG: hypothetical protein ACRD3H_05430 [Terriglobales bacterium]